MAINFISGLNVTSKEPIDARLVMTKAEMLAAKAARMPDVYFAMCSDDGQMYLYNSANEKNAETGKFRLLSSEVTNESLSSLISSVENSGLQVTNEGLQVAISPDEDNTIQQTVNGLKVVESESIADTTINDLFEEEEENV